VRRGGRVTDRAQAAGRDTTPSKPWRERPQPKGRGTNFFAESGGRSRHGLRRVYRVRHRPGGTERHPAGHPSLRRRFRKVRAQQEL